jgi:putative ABC transport system permease protein
VLIGVAIGLVAALLLTQLLKGFLFGVSAADPLTFVGIVLLLALAALLACWFPAFRAARVHPTGALRCE